MRASQNLKVLDLVAMISIPAQERFVAADHLRVDVSDKIELKIGWLEDGFRARFSGKTEEPVDQAKLTIHALTKTSPDESIFKELGGRGEILLSQFWALLTTQGCGEEGPILTNSGVNVAYIRDVNDELCAVSARWLVAQDRVGAWKIGVSSVSISSVWPDGIQIIFQH